MLFSFTTMTTKDRAQDVRVLSPRYVFLSSFLPYTNVYLQTMYYDYGQHHQHPHDDHDEGRGSRRRVSSPVFAFFFTTAMVTMDGAQDDASRAPGCFVFVFFSYSTNSCHLQVTMNHHRYRSAQRRPQGLETLFVLSPCGCCCALQ